MLYVLFNNNNVIGCFNDKQQLDMMMNGLKKNKLCNNLKYQTYHPNSICLFELNETIETTPVINKPVELTEKDIEKKRKLEYNLNVLKQRKERLEESQRTYKVDFDLFNKFKKIRENDSTFEIPPLFIKKWELMLQLEEEGRLNWENFHSEYKHEASNNNYSEYFDGDLNAKDRELIEDTEVDTTDDEL